MWREIDFPAAKLTLRPTGQRSLLPHHLCAVSGEGGNEQHGLRKQEVLGSLRAMGPNNPDHPP